MTADAIEIYIPDVSYGKYETEAEWEWHSSELKRELEREYGLPFEPTSIGHGAASPAYVATLAFDASPHRKPPMALFFKGEHIKENLEAWLDIGNKLAVFFPRKPTLNRSGAAILAVDKIASAIGRVPATIKLIGYRRITFFDEMEQLADFKPLTTIEAAPERVTAISKYVFHIAADDWRFIVLVEGHDVQLFVEQEPGLPDLVSRKPGSLVEAEVHFPIEAELPPVLPAPAATSQRQLPQAQVAEYATWVSLLFATTRRPEQNTRFSGERNDGVISLGETSVRIPEKHQITKLERPFKLTLFSYTLYEAPEDPEKHFIAGPIRSLSENEWRARITEFGAADCLVFVHGFNTSFQDAAFRFAQIVWDLRFDGLPVLFSWPSRGIVQDYVYDRDSALGAGPQLVEVLQKIAAQNNIRKIHILAHSMGNFCLLDGLANHLPVLKAIRLGEIVMAAPDIDRDLYKQRVIAIRPEADGMTLYASAADRALAISKRLAGDIPRAGDIFEGEPILVDGVDAIDVTFVGEEMFGLGHGTYAGTRAVLNDMKLLLTGMRPPHARLAEIGPVPDKRAPRFWRYQ